jgi:outer membrane protein assembly factor BamE (lipoprotein component of BamABCDE complex)
MKLIKLSAIALAVFTVILTIVFMIWWAFKEQAMFGSEKFDQTRWMQLANTVQQECKRGDMAYDLKSNILMRGAHKDAVMALLGRPSLEDSGAIEYDLGKCMHVYHALRVYFDANNRLTHSQISSH